MTDLIPEKIENFLQQTAQAATDSWAAHGRYYEGMIKRNSRCFSVLGEARMASFKGLSQSKTFSGALAVNQGFEKQARDELSQLRDDSAKAWEILQQDLKAIYSSTDEAAESPVTPKPASGKGTARKATPKKAALKKAVLKKAAPQKAAPQKVAPKKTTLETAATKVLTPPASGVKASTAKRGT